MIWEAKCNDTNKTVQNRHQASRSHTKPQRMLNKVLLENS